MAAGTESGGCRAGAGLSAPFPETKLGRDLFRPRPSHTHRKSTPLGEPCFCANPARREIQDINRAETTESVNPLD